MDGDGAKRVLCAAKPSGCRRADEDSSDRERERHNIGPALVIRKITSVRRIPIPKPTSAPHDAAEKDHLRAGA